ncbi:hypothetical protein GLOIN_2v1881038 [Rhizophagus clarus]|uniref:Ion transport domain-containing protein n=1 Tax=Rhizophagus clarus TaxID=94130 RepID=A0A8H3MEA5_9GLOM|nr:hypothetical protein GLOIN_2v1881038 [Rhizophagus clarus]
MDDYKIDMLDAKSENVKEEIEETKANIEEIETHRKNIDKKQTIFSQDVKYAVTYSKQDNSNSLLTWSINTESVGEQQYDQYLELEQKGYNEFSLDLIHKKIVLFHYKENGKIKYELVDLTERKFLDLRETLQIPEEFPIIKYSIGFFSDDFNNSNDSNDRLILVSLYSSKSGKKDYKIYEYSFKDKQITTYDIVIPKGLEDHNVNCCINETKLFFFACDMTDETRNYLILQWDLSDLSAMTFEMQYHLLEDKEMPLIMFKEIRLDINGPNFVMNEGKTLLAIRVYNRIYIFSMESGLQVSTLKFKESDFTMESFVSSNDVPEGLIVSFGDNALFLDPFDPFSDVIEIDYTGKNSKITNKGKKISTIENSVHVTNELKKNLSRKILENNHYYSNLYTLSIFQTIRNLFEEILKGKIKSDCSDLKMITIQGRFYFVSYEDEKVEIWGRTSSKNEDILTQFPATFKFGGLFAFKLLNNSDLVLITDAGIHIYTIISASIALRYFWVNEDWKNNFQRESTIIKILENEFKESRSSLPPPTFETLIRSPDDDQHSSLDDFLVLNPDYEGHYKYKELLISIICLNTIELSKFGKEMLKISIEKKNDVIVGTIIDRIIEIIQNNSSDPSSNEENSGNSSSIEESFGNPTSIEKNSSDPSSNEKNTSDPSSNEKNSGNSSSIEESSGNPASIEKSTSDPSSNEKNSGNSSSIEENSDKPTSIEKNSNDSGSNEKSTSDPSSNKKNSVNPSLIKKNSSDPSLSLLPIISIIRSNLSRLSEYYSDYELRIFSYTSIMPDPMCSSVKTISTSFPYAYSKNIEIKKSTKLSLLSNNYFKPLLSSCSTILNFRKYENIPVISFIVPYNYSWNEILCQPESILFHDIDSKTIYNGWNLTAFIAFNERIYYYYYFIWFLYTIFYLCFALASTLESNLIPDVYRTILLIISVILGLIHILVEIWQFYWLKENYFKDPCNFFDLGAYLLPIITSLHWIIKETPPLWIIAFSNLFLSLKFLLFFRVFHHFGIYFTIIVGVAKKISPFLIVLFIVIFGFSHTFYILLRPTQDFSFDNPTFNNDKNNPWNLATKYNLVNPDGTINPNATMIQPPDSNTNLFDWFPTSLLAMYLFITGNNGSLSPWDYRDYQAMTVLLEYLIQKAKIIVETEIFYMLHYKKYQKQNLDWIYYNIPINNVRKLIEAIKDHKIEFDAPPYIRNELKKLMKFRESKESFKEILKQKSRYKTLRETYKMNVQRGWLIDLIRDPPVNHKIN